MTTIGSKKFNWVRTLSARENIDAWREKRKNTRQDFESQTAAASSSFNTAWFSQAKGTADLGIATAIARVQKQIEADKAKQAAAAAKDDNNIPSTKESVFSLDSKMTLGSGSTIDIKNGTMTLKDGTEIDLKTGYKKPKVNVVT